VIPPAETFEEVGDNGPNLLLIHGTAADASGWAPLTRLLGAEARTIAYDRRGGPRWPSAAPLCVADHVADAADLIGHLGAAPLYICGVSFGAVIALELMRAHPKLDRGAALFEPGVPDDDAVRAVQRSILAEFTRMADAGKGPEAAEQFHRRLLSDRAWNRLSADARDRARGRWSQILADLTAASSYDPRYPDLTCIDVPVLLLRGGRSRPVFEPVLRKLGGVLPRSQRRDLESAGHWVAGQAWSELAAALRDLFAM
jgi:pimeloyl-ACP methyl ester carboxylesterase